MPDSRLSRWKAKLLRRSSSPSAPRADQSVEAVDPKSKSSSSFAPPLFFSDEGDSRGPQSAVSSLFVDYLISDDISGPGTTGSTADQGTIPDRLSAQQGSAEEPRSVDKNVTTDCVRNPLYSGSTPELATSPLQTPITPTTPRTSPLPAPEKPATSALLSTTWNSRGRPAGPALEPQLTPSLNTVVGNPLGNPKRSSLFPPYSTTAPSASPKRPPLASRQQSLLPKSQQHLVSELLDPGHLFREDRAANHSSPTNPEMLHRKIWVKRPGGSATLVPALSDAVVDELRDQVIVKYGNSLGRNFDSPDIAVRIFPREGLNKQTTPERILNPDEPLMSVVDTYYPGGQKAEEALMIDIPQRRTPKPSPRHSVYYHHSEPAEHGDYFTLMPSGANVSTPPAHHSATSSNANSHQGPSISILTTGMAPPLPSPGSRPCRRRPQLTRHTTHSPTVLGQAPTSNGIQIRVSS